MQLSIFADTPPQARVTDPLTSKQAAVEAKHLQAVHQRLIVACLEQHGSLGKDGIAARTKLTGVAVARRTTELHRLGLIKPTGKTVQSTSGRAEREWCIA